jgi:hypothetical protein
MTQWDGLSPKKPALMLTCGPYVCAFPDPKDFRTGARWTCQNCGTSYKLSRPKPERWWRNWSAPAGHWRARKTCRARQEG